MEFEVVIWCCLKRFSQYILIFTVKNYLPFELEFSSTLKPQDLLWSWWGRWKYPLWTSSQIKRFCLKKETCWWCFGLDVKRWKQYHITGNMKEKKTNYMPFKIAGSEHVKTLEFFCHYKELDYFGDRLNRAALLDFTISLVFCHQLVLQRWIVACS